MLYRNIIKRNSTSNINLRSSLSPENQLNNLKKIALEDAYFIERKLYPNVDFYSGITLSALGIPTNMFTVIFALARTVGWVSQWEEMMADPKHRIARPRQLYIGNTQRNYIPIEKR